MSVRYSDFIKRALAKVMCRFCDNEFLLKQYHRHLLDTHPEVFTLTKKICIWCLEYTWRKGMNNYEHRFQCAKKLIGFKEPVLPSTTACSVQDDAEMDAGSSEQSTSTPAIDFDKMDLTRYLNCTECNDWYEKERISGPFVKPFVSIDDSCGFDIPIDDEWLNMTPVEYPYISNANIGVPARKRIKLYEEEKLVISKLTKLQMDPESGIDGYWMRLYLSNGKYLAWFHYSIRLKVWKKFYTAACENPKLFCVMPYWCICSGGDMRSDEMHHRHIIVVCARHNVAKLKKIMCLVTFDDGKLRTVNSSGHKMDSKYHKEIGSVKHFMNTWRYVSSVSSMCSNKELVVDGVNQARNENTFHGAKVFGGGRRNTVSGSGMCHYYISRPMIPHCFLGMAMYFPDGFQAITEILKMSLGVSKFKNPSRDAEGRWRVPLKDLYSDIQNHVFPTCKEICLHREEYVENPSTFNVDDDYNDGDDDDAVHDEAAPQFAFIGTLGKKGFSLVPDRKNMSRAVYNRSNIEMGNAFVNLVVDSHYNLNRTQQKILNEVHEIRVYYTTEMQKKDQMIARKDEMLEKKDEIIIKKDDEIIKLHNEISRLHNERYELIHTYLKK